jgi:hypothetical protein
MRLFGAASRVAGWSAALVIAGGALTGCGPSNVQRVAIRHAGEFDCEPEDVEVEELGADNFRATGCGGRGVYVCVGRAHGTRCVADSVPR